MAGFLRVAFLKLLSFLFVDAGFKPLPVFIQ
jgi:hypothetical protein